MTQDELKRTVAKAAADYVANNVPAGSIVGVGTGSTANLFIDELAKIKDRIAATVASSEATKKRLEGHGIKVIDLNDVSRMPVYVDGADEITARLPQRWVSNWLASSVNSAITEVPLLANSCSATSTSCSQAF